MDTNSTSKAVRSMPRLGGKKGLIVGIASGIGELEKRLDKAVSRAPDHRLVTIAEVGAVDALLCSEATRAMTDNVVLVDAGHHGMG